MSSFLLTNFLDGAFNNSDSDGLFHISNGKSSQWWILLESFNAHWLSWFKDDQSRISVFDEFGLFLHNFTCSSINFSLNFLEFAGNMSSVAI
jgi:hypothetical protein